MTSMKSGECRIRRKEGKVYIVGVYYPMVSISQFKSMMYIGGNTAKQNEERHAMVHKHIWFHWFSSLVRYWSADL